MLRFIPWGTRPCSLCQMLRFLTRDWNVWWTNRQANGQIPLFWEACARQWNQVKIDLENAAPTIDTHLPNVVDSCLVSCAWNNRCQKIKPAHGWWWLYCQLSFCILHQISPGYHQKVSSMLLMVCKWKQTAPESRKPPLLDSVSSEGESEDRHSTDCMNSFSTCPPLKWNQYDMVIKVSPKSPKSTE